MPRPPYNACSVGVIPNNEPKLVYGCQGGRIFLFDTSSIIPNAVGPDYRCRVMEEGS